MPKRIQRKRTKGWRMPPNTVYVGRPTKWGNPFRGADAVEKYRKAVSEYPVKENTMKEWLDGGGSGIILIVLANRDMGKLDELRCFDLACWCPLDKSCHADVLLEIVNYGKI